MNARLSKNPKFFGSNKDEWLKEAFVMETIVPKTSPVGRKRKKLGDESIGRTTRNKIVDSIVNDIEEFAQKEGVSNNELLDLFIKRSQNKWRSDENVVKILLLLKCM